MTKSKNSDSVFTWIFVGLMLFSAITLVACSEVEGAARNADTFEIMVGPTATSEIPPSATHKPTPTATSVSAATTVQILPQASGRITAVLSDTDLESEMTWTPPHSPMHGVSLTALPIEISAINADTIARVKLIKVEGTIYEYDGQEDPSIRYYTPLIRYEFEALEYLKGGRGKDRIWSIVYLSSGFSSEQDAPEERSRAVLSYYLNLRESRWDNQEAIVFLEDSMPHLPSTHPDDHYYLGEFFENTEVYALSATRQWLPLAHSEGVSRATGESGANSERSFLLKHPDGHVQEGGYVEDGLLAGVSGASASATIGLSELKRLAAMSDGELWFRWGIRLGTTAVPLLTATATHNSVSLGWELHIHKKSEVPFQAGYHILRRGPDDDEFKQIANLAADAKGYTDTANIKPASSYTYILRMLTVYEHNVDVQAEVTTADEPATPTPSPTPAPATTATSASQNNP